MHNNALPVKMNTRRDMQGNTLIYKTLRIDFFTSVVACLINNQYWH